MNERGERTLPWSIADARSAFLPILFGGVVLVWGWWEASGTGRLDEQTTAVAFSLLAAGVVVAGAFAWIAAGRRAVRLRRLALFDLLEQRERFGVADDVTDPASNHLVAVAGTTRYHRPDCLLVRGKDAQLLAGEAAGRRTPCEMCQP